MAEKNNTQQTITINGWTIQLMPPGFEFQWEAVKGNFADRFYSRAAAVRFAEATRGEGYA